MKVVESVAEMKKIRAGLGGTVGFVPTMGYLHEGHISLVKRAKTENDFAVASIFVNPTQFGPNEDFDSYPRAPQRDLPMLEKADTDFVFMPPVAEMYPKGYDTWVEVGKVSQQLEGSIRPTHFRGVTTVVAKLFNIVQPTKAYFGQKDVQQCIVLKKMVADLNMNLEMVICPTIRETDGLAMSSRNTYLSPEERRQAPVLYQSLVLAQRMWSQGERNAEKIRQAMTKLINTKPDAVIDYISIADPETLEEMKTIKTPAVISMTVKLGKPRLLDNIILE